MAKKQTVKKVKRSKRQPNVEFAVNGCLVTMTYSEWEKQCQKWKEKQFVFHKDYLEDVQYMLSQSYDFSSCHFYTSDGYAVDVKFFLDLGIEYIGCSVFHLNDICPYIMLNNKNFIVVEKNEKYMLDYASVRKEKMYMTDDYNDALSKMLVYYRNDDNKHIRLEKKDLKFEYIDDYVVMTFTRLCRKETLVASGVVEKENYSIDYFYLFHKEYADELKDLYSYEIGSKYKPNSVWHNGCREIEKASESFVFRKQNNISSLIGLKDICNYIALTEDGYVVVRKGNWNKSDIADYSTTFDNLDDALEMLESL